MSDNLLTAEKEPKPHKATDAKEAAKDDNKKSNKPDNVPEKFWDAENEQIRIDALLKSYLELEKKLATMIDPQKADKSQIGKIIGVPETPEGYELDLENNLLEIDPDMNALFHESGFTKEQVQLVYNLAEEKMLPMIVQLAEDFQADKEVEKLKSHFGGEEKWAEISRQMLEFGKKNLPGDVLKGLASSYEGVMALYSMMQSGEPSGLKGGDAVPSVKEDDLKALMNSPKYWREKDPATVKKVTEGFKNLYS